MPTQSRWKIKIPEVTLPTFLFGSPNNPIEDGHKPALLDAEDPDNYYLTYDSYRLWSKRLAAGLRKAGVGDGDAVMLFSGNTLFFPVVLIGTVMSGAKFTGANPSYVAREVAYQLQNSEAKFLICSDVSLETGLEAAKSINFPKERVLVFDNGVDTFNGKGRGMKGCKHWTSLLASVEEGEKYKWEEIGTPEQLNRTIALNYSSGTTGVPKGVEITHKNYVSNTLQHMFLGTLTEDYEQKKKDYRWLCFLPMYHAMAQTIYCVGGPSRQVPVYIMRKFDFVKFLENIQKFRISELQLVPPIVVMMAKSPVARKYDLSSVKTAGAGAAPLGSEVTKEFATLWPPGVMNLKQGYGMTESTCSLLGWDPREYSDSFAVGEPNANVEIKLMNDEGTEEVPAGERGEVWARGSNIMKGYWKNEKATKETLTEDGWLKTGDIAYVDKHGKFFVVDRKKELIKVKGLQVAPAELEALLLEHPAVSDAAVIGVTINGEELPRAYVVKTAGKEVTAEEIKKFLEKKVSRHKRLQGGVIFTDAIMKNPSGKILRRNYREEAQKEIANSSPKAKL